MPMTPERRQEIERMEWPKGRVMGRYAKRWKVGDRVRFVNGWPVHTVEHIEPDGMVQISGYAGYFSPDLFVAVPCDCEVYQTCEQCR